MRREKDWPVFHGAPNSQPKIPKIKIFFFIVNNGLICILVMFIFIKTNLILQNCSFRSPTAEMKCKLWVTNEALQWLKKCYSKFLPVWTLNEIIIAQSFKQFDSTKLALSSKLGVFMKTFFWKQVDLFHSNDWLRFWIKIYINPPKQSKHLFKNSS